MKALKNIFVGFLLSFIGSIPLGYLNIVGFEIYTKFGMNSLFPYLFGVISIEVLVIYFTLIFASQIANNKKLIKFIDIFSIFFMFLLAYSFHSQSNFETGSEDYLSKYITYSPYFIGVILSSFNFIQIPFWTGWNLYLINANYISVEKKLKHIYVIAALFGTFFGMLILVLGLNLVTQYSATLSKYMLSVIIPLFFIGMACFQIFKVYKKHYFLNKN